MFGMMSADAYLYLYAAAIRAGAADPAEIAAKGAEDFRQFQAAQEAGREAKCAEREAARKAEREAK